MATVSATAETVAIASASDWAAFANRVNAGETALNATMTANVTLGNDAPRVGTTEATAWTGEFDGGSHTLTVDWSFTGTQYAAPFAIVSGCKIHDLHITGSISSDTSYVGGFVGWAKPGPSTFERCRSSVALTCTMSGDVCCGGFVGRTYWATYNIYFRYCLFDGSLLGPNANWCAGFASSPFVDPNVQLDNCLFDPAQVEVSDTDSATLAATYNASHTWANSSYYTKAIGRVQGTDASSMSAEDLAAALGENWAVSNGKVLPKTFVEIQRPEPAVAGFVYQGALRDAQGHALGEGTRTVEFRLYDTATGGSPLWGRAHGVRFDTNGLFLAELSDEAGDALPNVVSNGLAGILGANAGSTLYLGLTVSGSDAEIAPRQRILAAPFALRAADLYGASGDLSVAGKASAAGGAVTGDISVSDVRVAGALATASLATSAEASASGSLTVEGAISGYGTFPVGAIVLWSGAEDKIPDGWALCNGATVNGVRTPDLRNRFVPGAGGQYGVGATGGEERHSLSVSEIPSHSHPYQFKGADMDLAWDDDNYFYNQSGKYGGNGNTKWTDNNGSGQAHENRPPYHALCYIIRVR